jgi:hypothetical protein
MAPTWPDSLSGDPRINTTSAASVLVELSKKAMASIFMMESIENPIFIY